MADHREAETGSERAVESSEGEAAPSSPGGQKTDELSDLLDDALKDFDNLPIPAAAQLNSTSENSLHDIASDSASAAAAAAPDSHNAQDAFFNQIFSQSDPSAFENFFSSLMSGDSSKLEQHFPSFDAPSAAASGNISETLEQTIGSLMQNTQQLQDDNITEDEILKMMSSMGLNGEMPGDEDFLPMMQGMMKDLLSKDVLYPSLKEISAQYPKWLSENRGKIDAEQFRKYEEQHRLMAQIVQEFESEKTTDAEDVKQKRLERIIGTMQRMQELGHPPKEIVGEMPNGLELDEDGLPKLPSGLFPNPEQCNVM